MRRGLPATLTCCGGAVPLRRGRRRLPLLQGAEPLHHLLRSFVQLEEADAHPRHHGLFGAGTLPGHVADLAAAPDHRRAVRQQDLELQSGSDGPGILRPDEDAAATQVDRPALRQLHLVAGGHAHAQDEGQARVLAAIGWALGQRFLW